MPAYYHEFDQVILCRVIKEHAKKLDVTITNTPANYTQIFDLMRNEGEPIIEHTQASRKFRRKIGV